MGLIHALNLDIGLCVPWGGYAGLLVNFGPIWLGNELHVLGHGPYFVYTNYFFNTGL